MFAVIKSGGKQYSVESGKILKIEKIEGKKGDTYVFNEVLLIGDSSKQTLGTPIIRGASVEATITEQIRSKKVIVFKKKRRKNYRRTKGHRQRLTVLKINKILNNKTVVKTKKSTVTESPDKIKKEIIKKSAVKSTTQKKKSVSATKIKKKTIKKKTVKKKTKKNK